LDSLRNRTIQGVSWNLIGNVAGSGISFFVGIVLARLLTPADFGLVGMISILLAISNSIVESGISTALIRKSSISETDYSTAFIFNMLIGILLYLGLFLTSPLIATFFSEERLINLVRVLGLIVIINAFAFVHQTILTRNVSFKSLSICSITSSTLSGAIGIYLALIGFEYWSIVWQFVLRQFFNTILLWLSTKWIPSTGFSKTAFKSLFSFGSNVLFSGLISTFQQNLYYLIIGKIFSVQTLGYYNRAESFNALATSNITGTFSKVFFPVLSSLQNDRTRLRSGLVKVNCTTFLICATIMVFIAATAEPIIVLLIGSKWSESIWMLQLMSLATIVMPLNALNRDMLFINSRSDLFLGLQSIKLFLFIPGVFLAYFFGVRVLLYYSLLTSALSFFINSRYAKAEFGYSSWQQLRDVAPYLLIVSLSGLCMLTVSFIDLPLVFKLALQLSIGFIVLLILLEIFRLPYYLELRNILFLFFKRRAASTK
jgi:teichuronic acid exporter